MGADHEDLMCLLRIVPWKEGEHIHEDAFFWASLPIERAITAGADRLCGRGTIQLFLQVMQSTWL